MTKYGKTFEKYMFGRIEAKNAFARFVVNLKSIDIIR